ncbi:LacI family DNA-binding transcriptional regulator [Mangrovicoccus sp. HB161399]|uniref:LacI family DNA-binding transcriptional regulator n=1 Tax=Mangrovicoccus sp. HB161399 TaxID=2720392 RepID=UPI001556541B|nr:LacI family DNA-binding transcriptional regulator [Mangrovicoccus sp. HB161399]
MAKRAGRRVTLADVAQAAGVGSATVDRVVNERGNVSEEVSRKVLAVARELGLNRRLPQSHRRLIRIEVILVRPELPLIARMHQEFRRLAAALDASIVLHRTMLKTEEPAAVARALRRTGCDAVIVYARNDPAIRDAVAALDARGVPVVTLISDLPETARIGYAGPDHYRSGRTAGFFIRAMARAPGTVIVLCNSRDIQSHSARIRGIEAFMKEQGPGFRIRGVVEGRDDRVRSEALLRKAFAEAPEAVAVYNVGAANLGVEAAIRAAILDAPPVFVGHELTLHSARMLREGIMSLAIDQSPEVQAKLAVSHVLKHFDFAAAGEDVDIYDTKPLEVVLYSPENIPLDMAR